MVTQQDQVDFQLCITSHPLWLILALLLLCHFLILTNAPSSWKMAAAPRRLSGAIFLLQRLRRNVSDDLSFLWNFQPIREENSQPSGLP